MCMSLLCISNRIFPMTVLFTSVRVTMVMEQEESKDVRGEAEASNDQNELGVTDHLGLDEALDGLQKDGKT